MVSEGPGAERRFGNEKLIPQVGARRATETVGTSGVGRYGTSPLVRSPGSLGLDEAQISQLERTQAMHAVHPGKEKLRVSIPPIPNEVIMEQLCKTQIRRGDSIFQIATFTEVPDAVIEAAMKAAEITRRESAGQNDSPPDLSTFRFVFVDHLVDQFGEVSDASAGYLPFLDFHIFSLKKLGGLPGGYTLEEQVAMATAHEETHREDRRKGRDVRPGHEMSREEYREDPHENRARQAEMRVLELMYPDSYYLRVSEATGFSREFAEQIPADAKVAINIIILSGVKRIPFPGAEFPSYRESGKTSRALPKQERSSIIFRGPSIENVGNRLSSTSNARDRILPFQTPRKVQSIEIGRTSYPPISSIHVNRR